MTARRVPASGLRGRPRWVRSVGALPSWAAVGLIALATALVLLTFASGYGYHRDELYFLTAGHHLAASYPDQGPLTPLLARAMSLLAPHSLTVLRLPSALMTAGTIALTGALAAELGASRRGRLIASACAAVSAVVLAVGHLLSTTTFDLLAWAMLSWLVARILRSGRTQLWVAAGCVVGIALLNKPLIAFYAAALLAGIVLVGPRQALKSRWLLAGIGVALVLWSPWLIWQAQHGWPQREVSSAIASGGSGSSQPRWALLPFQLLLVSPVLAPVWIAGLVRLLRSPELRAFRAFAVAWLLLVLTFLVTGGKPYYLAGMFPVLLAAGAAPTARWMAASRWRARSFGLAVALSAAVSAVIALPLLPARDSGIAVAMNGDVGETIGWPDLVSRVATAARATPGQPVIFTENYGEAGAIDRYGPALRLPRAYSGHNGFGLWGPPRAAGRPVITVGLTIRDRQQFAGCTLVGRVQNAAGIDNDERGASIERCRGPRAPWPKVWPRLRHLG